MTKLTVIVTCSDRKSARSVPTLQVRNLPRGPVASRAAEWRARLNTAPAGRLLRDLYRGESWSVVPRVLGAARRAGFAPELVVASAGLGLRRADTSAPAYAATFASGKPDAVASSPQEAREWWQQLRAAPHVLEPAQLSRGAVLLVLSQTYAAAMFPDLVELGRRGDDVLLIGGATDVPGINRIPADRGLRPALGGTTTGLTMRMAHRWLSGLTAASLACPTRLAAWQMWAARVWREEAWLRQPLGDEEVREFVRNARAHDPGVSRTRALRELRDSGWACEQSRFAVLFEQVVDSA